MPSGHYFEGAEKLLEIWFTCHDNLVRRRADLRTIKRCDWEGILDLVNCKIISVKSTESITAYVLSESSMFITKYRFILKTCGSTTLLHAVKPVIDLVKQRCGLDVVEDIFFSRKNFNRPEMQIAPHTSFDSEVSWLDAIFKDGAAYNFGRVNSDCWHLYTVMPHNLSGVKHADQTMELIMTDLDPKVMSVFYKHTSKDGPMATKLSGIDTILPKSVIDDFLFDPCGYSANGIMSDGQYWTIHITPEPDFAYVSFETNIPQKSYRSLVRKVLNIFKPGKASLTIFANEESVARDTHKDAIQRLSGFDSYKRTEIQTAVVKNYSLTYCFYKSVYS